ncbi:nuclear transport factor 2 family protein [Xanthomonas tesorieronis]|uniref:nuclear transport factor 2 family protein n=1 Tax=Xanthomonas tesorieronis TaxID=3160839 RepID=UPI0035124C2F
MVATRPVQAAVEDLLNNRELSVAEAMDRHFSVAFRQCTDGKWEDRAAVIQRIAQLRDTLEHATFTVHEELSCGTRYAERHTIGLALCDGSAIAFEVHVFAERDRAGRFLRIEEATRRIPDDVRG